MDWLDGLSWVQLGLVWFAAAVVTGLIEGAFIPRGNPTDEGPERLEGYHDRVIR